ncbi:MAG: aconitase X catalytic domain-containing protein, partial [Atribacterota bacterium]|nr:aconitase X catalytic domain-containing protein [Atribacterota bacterium]
MAIKLTPHEEEMLDGKYGYPIQMGMQIQVQMGEIYGAEKMIPVSSVHMVNASALMSGDAVVKLVEKMVAHGGKFKALTTLNPAALDYECWQEIGFSQEIYAAQTRLTNAYQALGAIPSHSCTPYLFGFSPKFGEHVAWGESSAVNYVNSVIGARTNREGGPSALAAALTGLVPSYGYHLDKNRKGNYLVQVEIELKEVADYGSLGYYIGKIVGGGIPVFTGIPRNVPSYNLKMLAGALASSGSVALFHAEGVTPEALTLEDAFNGQKPIRIIKYGQKEQEEAVRNLNKNKKEGIKIIVIGCPHADIMEIKEVADQLQGKRIKDGIEFWVQTSLPIKELAGRCGFTNIIKSAGARIIVDTCPVHCFEQSFTRRKGFTALATNSAKLAHYVPGMWTLPTYFG